MVSFLTRLVALAALVAPIFAAPAPAPAHHLKIRNMQATDVVENSWIVVYHKNVTSEAVRTHEASISRLIQRRDLGGIGAKWEMTGLRGYQVHADEASMATIAAAPEIDYIEKDAKVHAIALTTQSNATWGLGRISHSAATATDTYAYDSSSGEGATVYVVDTGVYAEHSEFGGRASMGANFVSGSANTDENGHGTHCSGTIGGITYGVAKKASIVGVKVLDADGSGSNSGVISGINWVASNAVSNSVLSMSLGGSYSAAVNSAVTSTVNAGVTVVVAAGNDNANAAQYSPASAALAVTVGAITPANAKASFSNYGSVVDVFAPGLNILSSWIGSPTATNTISGTSMATPHVAGLAAYLIALEGLSSPSSVASRINDLAVGSQITGLPPGTANKIAYNGAA